MSGQDQKESLCKQFEKAGYKAARIGACAVELTCADKGRSGHPIRRFDFMLGTVTDFDGERVVAVKEMNQTNRYVVKFAQALLKDLGGCVPKGEMHVDDYVARVVEAKSKEEKPSRTSKWGAR